jgi:hypothetical protein
MPWVVGAGGGTGAGDGARAAARAPACGPEGVRGEDAGSASRLGQFAQPLQ